MSSFFLLTRVFLALAAGLWMTGCATNGYITSVISTGFGLDVSGNAQTSVPNLRVGYIRNGVYYIPTNKTGNGGGDVRKTPNVVSKIHLTTKFLDNVTISEKYAVGKAAVGSDGAQQLFRETSSEQMAHSKNGNLSASNLAAPLASDAPLPEKKSGRKVSGNKPQPGESGGPATQDRKDLQAQARHSLSLVPREKRTPEILGKILDTVKAPADVPRDGNGLAAYIGSVNTPLDHLVTISIELDKLRD